MIEATVTSKGQITIPKNVRDDLGLEPGVKVAFIRVADGDYRIRARNGSVEDLFGILNYDGPPLSIEELNEGIRDAAAGIVHP